jgi:kynurenine formamidase
MQSSSATAGASSGDTDPARYGKGNPGIGVKAAEFLIAKDQILPGADTAQVEVNPNPDKLISLPLHQIALVIYGVHLLENIKLDELAAKNVSEFANRWHCAASFGSV